MVIKDKKLINYLETDINHNLYRFGEFLLPSLRTLFDTEHFKVTRVWVKQVYDDTYIISYGWRSTCEPDMGHKEPHVIYTKGEQLQILGLSEQKSTDYTVKEYWEWLERNYEHFIDDEEKERKKMFNI